MVWTRQSCHLRTDKRPLGFFRGAGLEQERGIPDPLFPILGCDLPTCRRFWIWGGIVQAISAPRLLAFARGRQRSHFCLLVMGNFCGADNILGIHFSVAIYRWCSAAVSSQISRLICLGPAVAECTLRSQGISAIARSRQRDGLQSARSGPSGLASEFVLAILPADGQDSVTRERARVGGEILFTIGAILGAAALLHLIYRSSRVSTRPYALPTLICSIAVGLWAGYGMPPYSYCSFFLLGFLLGAVVFYLHAAAIKSLVEKAKRRRS